MTPEELLAAARAERKVVAVRDECVRWYRIITVKHPPPCYSHYCSCFVASDLATGDEETFSYQDLSEYDIPKAQVGTVFLWAEALEETAGGSRPRVTRMLFEGEVPEVPPEQPSHYTGYTSSEETIQYINNQVQAYLRQR